MLLRTQRSTLILDTVRLFELGLWAFFDCRIGSESHQDSKFKPEHLLCEERSRSVSPSASSCELRSREGHPDFSRVATRKSAELKRSVDNAAPMVTVSRQVSFSFQSSF